MITARHQATGGNHLYLKAEVEAKAASPVVITPVVITALLVIPTPLLTAMVAFMLALDLIVGTGVLIIEIAVNIVVLPPIYALLMRSLVFGAEIIVNVVMPIIKPIVLPIMPVAIIPAIILGHRRSGDTNHRCACYQCHCQFTHH